MEPQTKVQNSFPVLSCGPIAYPPRGSLVELKSPGHGPCEAHSVGYTRTARRRGMDPSLHLSSLHLSRASGLCPFLALGYKVYKAQQPCP